MLLNNESLLNTYFLPTIEYRARILYNGERKFNELYEVGGNIIYSRRYSHKITCMYGLKNWVGLPIKLI